jgi:hypothetical protein
MDLAINKVLALVGRDEARDFLDVIDIMESTLPLGALLWAAAGKDPGFTPLALLELLQRRGTYRPEDFARLHLALPLDLVALKERWRSALTDAAAFIRARPPDEMGCLYYDLSNETFVAPRGAVAAQHIALHFGLPGGVLPRVLPR